MLKIGIYDGTKQLKDQIWELFGRGVFACDMEIREFSSREQLLSHSSQLDIMLMDSSALRRLVDCGEEKSRECGKEDRPVIAKVGTGYRILPPQEILYIENFGRKVAVHLQQEVVVFYAKMEDLQHRIGEKFFRCHRGFLVNWKYIRAYDSRSIQLINGDVIFMSKQKYQDFCSWYQDYPAKSQAT